MLRDENFSHWRDGLSHLLMGIAIGIVFFAWIFLVWKFSLSMYWQFGLEEKVEERIEQLEDRIEQLEDSNAH